VSESNAVGRGEPDLRIGGLSLWIVGRHHSEIESYWEGNWLRIYAECTSPNSRVVIEGPLVHLSEITTLHSSCEKLARLEAQEAGLYCMEPNLKVELWAVPGGKVIGKVRLTPDHKSEMHDFGFALDAGELDALVVGCAVVLKKFPVRHKNTGDD
jgi:hypothetical protein